MAYVYIPVQNSEEEVRVALDQLPRDATDILDILKAEQAPLDLWLIIAREYFKQGKIEQFRQILEEGSSPEIDEYYADVRYERIAILNALGAYYSYLGKIETKQREKEDYFIQATKYYNKASRIDMHEPSTWIGKGQLLLAKGDVEQAFNAFKIVLDGDRDNVPALLGQACVHFNRGRYSESLELYKRALQVYPWAPGVRLGIALCNYKLGRFEKAKQAFRRVLQLDPDSVEALVALGVSDLQTNEAAGIRSGMEKMQQAFEIYPYCAMSLNYLANHFFFTGQHFLVEQLTETALAVTLHGPTKAHSYYNLARSYHSKGDYEKAGMYYMASVKECNNAHEFVLPYYGLGQVQVKLGDLRSALTNFEKVLEVQPENCETLKALGHIYVQLEQNDKAQELFRKATKIDPRDPQAFLDLGDLLITTDISAALDAFKTARNLLKKGNEEVPLELLNDIGILHFERGEFELAGETFKEALGEGIWRYFFDAEGDSPGHEEQLSPSRRVRANLINSAQYPVDASSSIRQYKDLQIFHRLEEQGLSVELPWYKVSTLFNLARVFEQMHDTESASVLYRLILFKYPDYTDAYLRLAAIAKSRYNVQISLELIGDALKVDEKCPDALLMLGDLELKNDDWVKAKETFRTAKDSTDAKDSYAAVCLGNWNYFAANRNEKRAPKLEATHYEKAKELYTKVLLEQSANLYAANGAGMVFAERGQFDIAKDLFTQVQEAASGSFNVQMPDVWINLAHVHFAQGNYALAVKMYQNCLRKFFYNTDSQVLLYLARTHYEAEQWQDCKKTLLRAIHLAPSNYTLRFDVGVALQKFSASTLQKTKRTVDEVRATVAELKNAVRLFSLLSTASNLHFHGFDEKKIETHVAYCKHLLEAANVHCELAEREEMQNIQRLEFMRQMELADESRRKAEEQRKVLMEKRKQEDELKQVMQQEKHLERIKEQWKSSSSASKRRDKPQTEDEEGGPGEKRKRRGGKRRKKDKKSRYESEEAEAEVEDQEEEMEYDDTNMSYRETNDIQDKEDIPQDLLAAAGLEDSDAEDNAAAPSNMNRRRRAWSESDEEDEEQLQLQRQPELDDMEVSDGEANGGGAAEDEQ
ncbi:TPR-containing nuclear phosphoprotein that regulates K(+) uptake [Handroanthus impetiginosus]|uniref:TPR-containing nuclear phosphoprotein that regulates K(+) uptake n=1 Tax=Handroanthus impetiginosus TaxID=429701 RepID=A0A2G9GUJ0_9LAMI|nr:TPR-containing nuclear phosphoprotein that regulates K(+) uptake [Handroanthus impetiginosus]